MKICHWILKQAKKLINQVKKTIYSMLSVLKTLFEFSIASCLLALSSLVGVKVALWLANYEVNAIFASTPSHIGEQSVQTLTWDEEMARKPLIIGNYHLPIYDESELSLTTYLFKDFEFESSQIDELIERKRKWLEKLFPYQQLSNVEPCIKVLTLLPIELLEIMVKDKLYFIVSDYEPIWIDTNDKMTGYYESKENRIVLFEGESGPKSVIHELAHWIESYLKRNVDVFHTWRMSEKMIAEIDNLGLSASALAYSKTTINEFFAVSFEVFMYHHELMKSKAPITYEYFEYYLTKLLKTYPDYKEDKE